MSAEDWNAKQTRKKSCCVGCGPPDRHPGCHATCEKKKAYDEELSKMREYLRKNYVLEDYQHDTMEKLYPGRRRER